MESTVVIITGDHGEEFYEHGYWGHTSAYSPEQVKVPLFFTCRAGQAARSIISPVIWTYRRHCWTCWGPRTLPGLSRWGLPRT